MLVQVTEIPTEMAFNVDHLLNTNSTPSQEQRNNLQNLILQLDETILNTDEDISCINKQILALQTKRTQLVQQRKYYSSLLSPVRCLPIEIFGKIFVYATHDRPRHVLNLSAVCQLWRDAALCTPVLWSTLELGHHSKRHNMDNHIDSWIERAHSYPLSLVIEKRDDFLDPVNCILTLITKHRWKSITLHTCDTSILSILKKLEFSNLETLETFSLYPQPCDGYYSKLSYPDALRYAPKLKTLGFHAKSPVAFDMLPFPWKQLTSLTITFWDKRNHNVIVDILHACVNLEELIIDEDCDEVGSNDSITLNYLRKLRTDCLISRKFLHSLNTPSIQDFAVKARYKFRPSFVGAYDYIKKNSSTLLKLSIAAPDIKLVENFPNLRSLVELKLYDDYDTNRDYESMAVYYRILSSLVVKPEMDLSTIPLPRLEVLEIICQATEGNQIMFMKVIKSRWWSDEEENARQKQLEGQQSLSRIKRSIFMNVRNMNVFCRDDADILRAQGMSIEYLDGIRVDFPDGMDEDHFY